MNEINIARAITLKRKEKGITQDELASYIGVSKASVSKWETGQNYPDITFLPQLAAYFNISIDDLMGYEPQMIKQDIQKLYQRLSLEFAQQPFDDVMARVREITKKYFSCFPLLLQIGTLLINHAATASTDERTTTIEEALELFIRVKSESTDVELCKKAQNLQAMSYLLLSKPEKVLEIYGDNSQSTLYYESVIISSAYMMVGKQEKANEVIQISTYQQLLSILQNLMSYLQINMQDSTLSKEIESKIFSICETFDVKHLHPSIMLSAYLIFAQNYLLQGEEVQALQMLTEYTNIATSNLFPLKLKGDSFFTQIDTWISELDLGNVAPKNEISMKKSIMAAVTDNPAFIPLADNFRFKCIIDELNSQFGG